ncbi:glycosyltransferase [Actinokineospora guangxiensis]|uniref:Glycosyltransferase n=1 Tax=Actinokineospora guangxiensis TaxID=1490288 RepID=A0ABW0EK08_9PSEU
MIYAYGSRGDVQPYLALARALVHAGHDAVLSAPKTYESFAAEHGVAFSPRDDEYLRLLDDPEVREVQQRADRAKGNDKELQEKVDRVRARKNEIVRRAYPVMLDDLADAADGADLVVHQYSGIDQAHHVAERLDVPSVLAVQHPNFVPSWHYPSVAAKPGARLPRLLNRLSHLPTRDAISGEAKRMVDDWRVNRLGLPARRGHHNRLRRPDGSAVPVLHAFSEHFVPPAPDWPETVHTTGFWFLPGSPDWTPPPELARFLAEGEPPIAVGFGSLVGPDAALSGRVVAEAVRAAGVRAVIVTGWGGIRVEDPGDDLLVIEQAPYDWLFPRVRAAVHAGGIGTISAALVAGIAQVACPFHPEQAGWSHLLHRHGAAPEPIRQRDLDPARLSAAITRVLATPSYGAASAAIGARVRAESGTATAVGILERIAGGVPAAA